MIFTLAVTGGIGTGKTLVRNYFSELGVVIIDADDISRSLTTNNNDIIKAIKDYFGEEILLSPGVINRKKLRSCIFQNKKHRLWLEQLLHPLIRENIYKIQLKAQGYYCVLEIPLLHHRNISEYKIDMICEVKASKELQLNRIMIRDNISEYNAKKIIASQEFKNKITPDYIIENLTNYDSVISQVTNIHREVLQLTKK
ncbi:MAG: dephospho-CoA kinase [Pseudomonadota bacterium]|nr:dephospho-CoA kinase [Pseudomonadota bacterium]